MVAIGSIGSTWHPGRGPVTTWTASPASRQLMAQASVDPLKPSFQQAQHLRSAHYARTLDRKVPRLILAAWDVDGWCDIAAMTEAINAHVRRHDTYHSAFDVFSDDDDTITIVRRTIDDPADIEFVPAAMGFMEQDEIREYVQSSTPGTLEWDCFTFGVIQKADHFTVYANIDHLHTDGSSGVLIYRDIHQAYQALVDEQIINAPRTAEYREYTAKQRLQVETMDRDSRPIKDWIEFAREADGGWPSFPLPLGDAGATGAGRAITIELLNGEQTEAFDTACRAAGARFSGGVMACAAMADHQFTGAEVFHTFTPSDTRSGDQMHSAGWYASLFPVTVDVEDGDFAMMARSAQKSFDANKHLSAVPFERAFAVAEAQGEELGQTQSKRPMMVSLFDFRKLADANANRLGMYIDDLNHGGINMWVTRNADNTIVTVSYPDTVEGRHSVHEYLGALRAAFLGTAALTEVWAETDQAFAHSA